MEPIMVLVRWGAGMRVPERIGRKIVCNPGMAETVRAYTEHEHAQATRGQRYPR